MAIEKSASPKEFLDFEQAGWTQSIAGYDDAFGPVSRKTVGPMLDATGIRSGMRVLDVCCGPGMLAEGAAARGATVVGLDFPEVIAVARAAVAHVEFRSGDAQALPFPDESFDVALCGYGLMHVPDAELVLREMNRVLRRGGRAGVSVWERETPQNGFGLVYAAVRAHGHLDVPLPHGADFFQFGTKDRMQAALAATGFTDVAAHFLPQDWRVRSGREVMEAVLKGAVRSRALLAAQSNDEKQDIVAYFDRIVRDMRRDGDGYLVPLPAIIGVGTKP